MTDSRRSLAQPDPTPKLTAGKKPRGNCERCMKISWDREREGLADGSCRIFESYRCDVCGRQFVVKDDARAKTFEQAAEMQKQLRNACQQAADLYDALSLGTLEAAAKYGPDWEPPTDEHMLEVRSVLAAALKAEEQADAR